MVANVVVFLFVQPSGFQFGAREDAVDQQQTWQLRDRDEFLYRYGTVPCEVVGREALVADPADCVGPRSDFLPDDKAILLSLLTAIFVHASIDHLAGNLLFLWVFSAHVEQRLGAPTSSGSTSAGVLASLAFVALHQRSAEPLIGASGAIAVAMGAYLVLVPRGRVLTVIVSAAMQGRLRAGGGGARPVLRHAVLHRRRGGGVGGARNRDAHRHRRGRWCCRASRPSGSRAASKEVGAELRIGREF
ncbi:MAG: rhomboid family intramembrane serine protease [Acidimicrobiales bacterium]